MSINPYRVESQPFIPADTTPTVNPYLKPTSEQPKVESTNTTPNPYNTPTAPFVKPEEKPLFNPYNKV